MHSRTVRIFLIFVLLAASAAVDLLRPHGTYEISRISGTYSTHNPLLISTPAEMPATLHIGLDVRIERPSRFGTILLLSGPSDPTLHIAFQRPRRVSLFVYGIGGVPIRIADNVRLAAWHHLEVFTNQRTLRVDFDGTSHVFDVVALHQLQSSAEIGSKDFSFRASHVELGGSPNIFPFRERIANLALDARYVQPLKGVPAIAGAIGVAALLAWLIWPWLAVLRFPAATVCEALPFGGVVAGMLCGLAMDGFALPGGKWAVLILPAAGALAGAAIAQRARATAIPRSITAIVAGCLLILSVSSLAALPNSVSLGRMFERWPLLSSFVVVAAVCLCTLAVARTIRTPERALSARWIAWLPYVLFAYLALRTDSLFQPINALHWDYFVGPIRTLRAGGWLLWDTPSQYGYLNVLLAALLPVRWSVDAFYWFQAAVSFAASAMFYRTLIKVLRINWIFAAALVIAFFYFADPLLIGPAPYPSMNAVRFLWCYALLAAAAAYFMGEDPSIERFAARALPLWLAGVLWSAESAVYVTVIYGAPLLAHLVFLHEQRVDARTILRTAVKRFAWPLGFLALAILLIEIIYHSLLKNGPDWSMYVAYVSTYGGGFGGRGIPPFGAIWVLGWILAGGGAIWAALRRAGSQAASYALVTSVSAVWIVSSYYVGRAFPVVITSLSPLFVFAIFIMLRAATSIDRMPLLAYLTTPLVTLGFVSAIWNPNVPLVLPRIAHPQFVAWARLPQAGPKLDSVLRAARIGPATAIVYYDSWVAMPRAADAPYENNWLPTPLQDLDQPIPRAMRDRIVTRFIERHNLHGYFVQGLGGYNVPADAQSWVALLSRSYHVSIVARNAEYAVLRFSPRAAGTGR